ncbi:TMEM165/GDT1 family protein [Candidatus Woesearchaeota archaeon]|nr:TMEM165/GDT1 family protein [Candidatus Woesearchaeota archaeon]
MSLAAFFTSFLLLLLSEVADKTMLLILGLALQYRSRLQVFLGALSAHALMDLVAIVLGAFFGVSIPEAVLRPVIAVVFVLLGLWQLYKLYLRRGKPKKKTVPKAASPFLVTFMFVAFSELGDKSQIISGLLGAEYANTLVVFIGVLVGLVFAIGLNVFVASKVVEKMPRRLIKTLVAVLFIVFGIATYFF